MNKKTRSRYHLSEQNHLSCYQLVEKNLKSTIAIKGSSQPHRFLQKNGFLTDSKIRRLNVLKGSAHNVRPVEKSVLGGKISRDKIFI